MSSIKVYETNILDTDYDIEPVPAFIAEGPKGIFAASFNNEGTDTFYTVCDIEILEHKDGYLEVICGENIGDYVSYIEAKLSAIWEAKHHENE